MFCIPTALYIWQKAWMVSHRKRELCLDCVVILPHKTELKFAFNIILIWLLLHISLLLSFSTYDWIYLAIFYDFFLLGTDDWIVAKRIEVMAEMEDEIRAAQWETMSICRSWTCKNLGTINQSIVFFSVYASSSRKRISYSHHENFQFSPTQFDMMPME